MKKASITEAKNNLSALIDGLKGGSAVLIRDRGRPVARLEPVTADLDAAEGRLLRLVRGGIVRPSSKSARKVGEILGCLGNCAVADRRNFDPPLAGFCRERSGHAGMVRIESRMRLGSCAART